MGLIRELARRAHQHRLARAGRPLDQDQRPLPRRRTIQSSTQRHELKLPLKKSVHHERHLRFIDDPGRAKAETRGKTLGDPPLCARLPGKTMRRGEER